MVDDPIIGAGGHYPLIYLRKLKLPKASDLVCRKPAAVYPAIDGILRDAEVLSHVVK
jgi:hypothetical protein